MILSPVFQTNSNIPLSQNSKYYGMDGLVIVLKEK